MQRLAATITLVDISSPLFRPEVIAARAGSWLGGVRLTQPGLFHLWGASGLVVAAALASFAAWGSNWGINERSASPAVAPKIIDLGDVTPDVGSMQGNRP